MEWKKAGKAVGRGTATALGWSARMADKGKRLAEPAIDKYLLWTAANAALFYGAAELIDHTDYSAPSKFMVGVGTGMAFTLGNYFGFLSPTTKRARTSVAQLNRDIDGHRWASWIKTGTIAASIAYMGSALNPYFQEVKQDIIPQTRDPPLATTVRPEVPQVTRERPKAYDTVGHNSKVTYDFSGTRLADKNTMTGRIQRTLRWQPIYHAIEKGYGLPEDTLAGMIMQESYGDPVQPNATDDGGLGLTHIQGTTAIKYGLKIYGNSGRDSDHNHGRQIRDMLMECHYDPACAQQYDDRAHVVKVLDAAARIVREGKEKHGSWDEGVEYFNTPRWVGHNRGWRYLRNVKQFRDGIRDPEQVGKAARDFQERNGYPFGTYEGRWHEMNSANWELREYTNRLARR